LVGWRLLGSRGDGVGVGGFGGDERGKGRKGRNAVCERKGRCECIEVKVFLAKICSFASSTPRDNCMHRHRANSRRVAWSGPDDLEAYIRSVFVVIR
jgi:hypothetical protein